MFMQQGGYLHTHSPMRPTSSCPCSRAVAQSR